MSVGSSTSACRIKRRARTTLRPASLSPRPKIFRTTCAETRDCGCIRGYARKSRRRKCPSKRDTDVGKKSSPGKRQKKKTSIGRTIPCVLALFGDCVPYEARATKHSTADVAYETATGRAPSCVSRNRRTQVSRVATRDSLLFAKSKKKKRCRRRARARSALDATPLGTRVRRRRTSRPDHARTCAPRRGKGWHRLALDPRASFARHDPRTSRRVLAGIFLNHEQETGRGRRPRR